MNKPRSDDGEGGPAGRTDQYEEVERLSEAGEVSGRTDLGGRRFGR